MVCLCIILSEIVATPRNRKRCLQFLTPGFGSYDLEFTVNAEYVAVSSGKLLHQVIIL
jgi:hypothetical protein